MRVLVVVIVLVLVLVFYRFVYVDVAMLLGQVKPDAQPHQDGGN